MLEFKIERYDLINIIFLMNKFLFVLNSYHSSLYMNDFEGIKPFLFLSFRNRQAFLCIIYELYPQLEKNLSLRPYAGFVRQRWSLCTPGLILRCPYVLPAEECGFYIHEIEGLYQKQVCMGQENFLLLCRSLILEQIWKGMEVIRLVG